MSGVTTKHVKEVHGFIADYLLFCDNTISHEQTIAYLTNLKARYSQVSYNKRYFQIMKFLRYLDIPFITKIPKAKQVIYTPQKINDDDIQQLLQEHKDDKQITSLILLGISSGARAEELYQLRIGDFNLEKCTIEIKQDRLHRVKNRSSIRTIFYDKATSDVLKDYIDYYNTHKRFDRLFAQSTVTRKMKRSQTKIKMLRHYFARQCTLKGIPSGVTKRFLGHSLNGDMLESHYNYLSTEDLQEIYNKYFGGR